MIIESNVAVPTSQTVGHNESMITSLTGRALLNEMPRSPRSVWRTYFTNCSHSESLTPNRFSSEATCESDKLRPRNRLSTGLSSTTRNRKKLNARTNTSVAIAPAILPRTNRELTVGRCYSRSSWLARRRTAKNPPIASRRTAPAATAIHSAVLLPPLEPSPVGVRLT